LLRALGLIVLLLLAAAWAAPAFVAPGVAVREAEAAGYVAEHAAVWPAWPIGISTRALKVSRGFQRLELSDVTLTWSPGLFRNAGWHLDATLGGGSIRAHSDTLGESGSLALDGVDASALPRPRPEVLLVGRASGDARWASATSEIHARIEQGSVSVPLVIAVSFDAFELIARREATGAVWIERLRTDGPDLAARVEGEVTAAQELSLGAVIERVGAELRGSLEKLGVMLPEVPVAYAISGPLQLPSVQQVVVPTAP
jgi:hypothetical protein